MRTQRERRMASVNETRFEALYRAHAREVYAYCLRRSNIDEAKDAIDKIIDFVTNPGKALPAVTKDLKGWFDSKF